jgi:hypothetical protein
MQRFGKPPDEFDGTDLPRLMRALEAQAIVNAGRSVRRWLDFEAADDELDGIDRDLRREIGEIMTREAKA